jgi:hypothetical protein
MVSRTHSRSTTNLRELRVLILIHNTAQTKVCDHDVRILSLRAEEQILGLQVLKESEEKKA